MLLMTEFLQDTTQAMTEEVNGKKEWFIEGVMLQYDAVNKNGRNYKKSILEREVALYNENYIKTNRAIGELNHPKTFSVNPERASHLITELNDNSGAYVGKAKVLNTPMGNIVKGLLEGGVQIGVSSRGVGSTKNVKGINEVQDDFKMSCIDVVAAPSAPKAFVNGIMEGVEYFVDHGIVREAEIEEIQKRVHGTKMKNLAEENVRIFMEVMNKLV